MKISSSFPGGNIAVDKIDGDTVYLHPDLRDTEGDWFYWYFRVDEAQGRTLRFEFSGCRAIAARGPAVSTDSGRTWLWLGADAAKDKTFTYTFGPNETATAFSMTIPHVGTDWEKFVQELGDRAELKGGVLCHSRKGRVVELLRIGSVTSEPEHRIALTARHHCCETMASYALEGAVAFLLSDDPATRRLRERTEFLVVPFVDRDGVEEGDQGKFRLPRDHNRDYDAPHLYPETAALREFLPKWSGGKLRAVLDLHCPWIAEGLHEKLYLVGSENPKIWEQQQRFAETLERTQTGPLPFRAADALPHGQDWNTAANYAKGRSLVSWAADLPEVRLAAALEVPYANASGHEVNAETARAFGADIVRALDAHLFPTKS